jgi:acetoin utilization deacetylase AcuC-like enzyme
MLYFTDPIFLEHDTGVGHPERPDRLRAIEKTLRADGLWDRLEHRSPRSAAADAITLVHPVAHVERIRAMSEQGGGRIDADTIVSARSFEAAALAVGAGIDACDAVMRGESLTAFCAVRPPGHHAESGRAMGFCLFNTIAIAARHAAREHGLERVAIIDWDVHHGNGTQEIFESDSSVLYASIHQHPLYPGTGMANETGVGEGKGFTLNIPLPSGSDDATYRDAFATIARRLDEFRPELLLISAGFDAHERDPLASMKVTTQGFRWMMEWALERAAEHCDGRLVAMLEGGYDLVGLSESVATCIDAMLAVAERR